MFIHVYPEFDSRFCIIMQYFRIRQGCRNCGFQSTKIVKIFIDNI